LLPDQEKMTLGCNPESDLERATRHLKSYWRDRIEGAGE
jgi:hypothetical protein